MPLHIYIASVAVGISIPALLWVLVGVRGNSSMVARNLRAGAARMPNNPTRRLRVRASLLPATYTRELSARINRAGLLRTSVERYLALKAAATIAAVLVGGLVGLRMGGSAAVLLPAVAFMAAWFGPDLQLSSLATARETKIELQLPDVLDQLTISIEAGLGFDAAMARLVSSSEGPVIDQMARVLQDMRLGVSRDVALRGLADRTGSADLRGFANAMALAGKHGIAIGGVLRAQAAEAREKRKFRAEERAHKIPVKILLPLVLFVLPTLFIVLLGPAVIRYQEGFGG